MILWTPIKSSMLAGIWALYWRLLTDHGTGFHRLRKSFETKHWALPSPERRRSVCLQDQAISSAVNTCDTVPQPPMIGCRGWIALLYCLYQDLATSPNLSSPLTSWPHLCCFQSFLLQVPHPSQAQIWRTLGHGFVLYFALKECHPWFYLQFIKALFISAMVAILLSYLCSHKSSRFNSAKIAVLNLRVRTSLGVKWPYYGVT